MTGSQSLLLIRPDDVSIPVRVELVETLRQAQGERFIVHKAGSIGNVYRSVCGIQMVLHLIWTSKSPKADLIILTIACKSSHSIP